MRWHPKPPVNGRELTAEDVKYTYERFLSVPGNPYDIQRHLSETVYYLLVGPSPTVVSAWEPYVKNFAPNLGNDYGGRLVAAWLDR